MPGFGGEVKLTGEEAYRRSLTAITEALKENGAALKTVADQYAKSDKSTNAVTSAQKELQSLLQKQKNTLDQTRQAYGQYAATLEQQKVKHQALTKEYKDAIKELETIRKTSGETSDAYKTQSEKVEKLKQQVAESNAEYAQSKATLKEYKNAMNEAEKAVKETEAQLDKLDNGMEEAEDSTKRAGQSAQNAAKGGFTVLKGVIADLASKVVQSAIQGFKNLAKSVADTGIEFDSAMSKVAAISGATADDLDKLTEKAQEMGRTTKFTASESAEAFNYMAMAGWKTQEMLDGIEGILNLAAASGADLATTSDIVTDALTGMGYAAKDAGRLADVMAAAAANANTTVEMMGVTFQYTTPIAGSLGYTMEDVALAIGLMANSGIKGERAGTALRSIMQRLASDTGKARTTLEKLGVTVINQDGTMRNFRDVLADSRKALNGLTDAQKTSVAKTVAGAQAMAGFLAIINATDENFNQLAMSIDNSNGAADRMAKTMLNNVGGKMTLLKSQLESIQIVIWKKLEPTVRKCIDSISNTLRGINWDKAGRAAAKAFENVTNVFIWLIDNWKYVVAGINAIIAAFVAAKVASFVTAMISAVSTIAQVVTGATTLTAAMGGLNAVMMANPIGLVVGALAALAVGIGTIIATTSDANDAAEEYMETLKEQGAEIEENKNSWKSLQEAQKETLNANMAQIDNAEVLIKELKEITDENGRVKAGYEARAGVILGILNDALGTEYKMTDGVIQKYAELRDGIDKLIEKKRAEIILNSQQALYEEAITKQADATSKLSQMTEELANKKGNLQTLQNYMAKMEEKYAHQSASWMSKRFGDEYKRIKQLEEETATLETQKAEQEGIVQEYYFTIDQYEKNYAAVHEGNYDLIDQTTWETVDNYQNAADAQKAILDQQSVDIETKLGQIEAMRSRIGDEAANRMRDQALREYSINAEKMNKYVKSTEGGLYQANVVWSDALAKQLSEITGQTVEFKDAGDGLMQMYVNGQKEGVPKSIDEITYLMNQSIKKMRANEPGFTSAGGDLIGGLNGGIINKQGTSFSLIQSYGSKLLSNLRASLKEHSPSKASREMGAFLLEGLNIGMKDEERESLLQAREFGESVVNAMSAGLNTGIDTTALAAVRDALPDDINGNVKIATAANTALAEAESPLVGAFKQALSEMKIELDSEVAGEFVDKKVTKLVYNL